MGKSQSPQTHVDNLKVNSLSAIPTDSHSYNLLQVSTTVSLWLLESSEEGFLIIKGMFWSHFLSLSFFESSFSLFRASSSLLKPFAVLVSPLVLEKQSVRWDIPRLRIEFKLSFSLEEGSPWHDVQLWSISTQPHQASITNCCFNFPMSETPWPADKNIWVGHYLTCEIIIFAATGLMTLSLAFLAVRMRSNGKLKNHQQYGIFQTSSWEKEIHCHR